MANQGLITMSMREVDRFKTLQSVIDGNLRAATAALSSEHRNPRCCAVRQRGGAYLATLTLATMAFSAGAGKL